MEHLGVGFKMMIYGMGTTFTILVIFYFLIKILAKLFPGND
ncbi:MAG TPA: OadG family protein [Clostridiales bacterium]|nr:OadG family protein [Clostridiales bacterium]